ncbi:uncharacterized protein EKO05_0001092 [Ascochyta rabiei]|uniref:CFEM domain-containing protein n=1 Tax=Didymella rabiei TaxID=5454 RepID=A0A162YRQ4_DIDRA|nr:uncharacterized protein EKO05_0001092 [Ascochyta rabiei]KZM20188.1 hypothetical protein ST47_g8641 [Ascochyta rabiei]UPX10431.1 hypothetical protein EKO05_0001092 [Ascochyta rabiei]
MKYTIFVGAVTAFAAAQTITDLPPCSLECLAGAIGGLGCGLTDFACSCQKASQLTPVVTPCVQNACTDPADQSKIIEVLSKICAAAGFPIEAPAAPASSPVVEPTPAAPSEAPIETQPSATEEPGYPEYPTASEVSSEYPEPTHITDDVPNLPTSYADLVSLPSVIDTIIVSRPSSKPTSVPGVLPPYPTGTPVPAPSGTGSSSTTSSQLPEFTGGVRLVKAPIVAAGIFGLAAFVV